ncbi:hypothetical protein VKS41_007010 [Umbelopsis sp. WA50703]
MVVARSAALLTIVLAQCWSLQAHLAVWTKAMYGQDRSNPNSNKAVQPLRDYTLEEWWWHGAMDDKPDADQVFELPAGGSASMEIADNKAFTSMGAHGMYPNPRKAPVPWNNTDNGWGNMHAVHRQDVAGCALGIAYNDKPEDVKPEDFAIFSVVHDCPARQLQSFDIPNLPKCPNGRCQCSWFWIHKSIGGTDQMYMTPFVCNVTNTKSTKKVGKAIPPVKCDTDPSKCVVGAKQPMYWMQKEGNNMFEPTHYAPTYSDAYNYKEGAQNDIFENGRAAGKNSTTKSKRHSKRGKMRLN